MVFFEKMLYPSKIEYSRRERQKDRGFKSRYFTENEIDSKRETVRGQVTLGEFIEVLSGEFAAAVITWNSGNFYTIAASDSRENLTRLVQAMSPPAIPDEYLYETLPRPLFGLGELEFRRAPMPGLG